MPGQPVILDTFGGLVVTARPEDIPEGASPRCIDTDFIVGRFIQRPGTQSAFSYSGSSFGPNAAGTAANVPLTGNAWANPNNILLNDGSFTVAQTVSFSSVVSVTVLSGGIYPSSAIFNVTFSGSGSGAAGTVVTQPYNGSLTQKTIVGITVTSGGSYVGIVSVNPGFGSLTPAVLIVNLNTPPPETDQLEIANFGFAVPSTSSIIGVVLTIKGLCTSGDGTLTVRMLKGGVPINYPLFATLPTTNGTVPLGNPTFTWGTTLLYSDVDASNWGFIISGESLTQHQISLDYASVTIYTSAASVNFNGMKSANLDQTTPATIALDGNGESWQETLSVPGQLAAQSLIPGVPAGDYLNAIDAGNGMAYMAYPNQQLTTGDSQPMQFNGQWCDRITQVGPGAAPSFTASEQAGAQASVTAYSYSAGILTLTSANTFAAGELVTFSGFSGGAVALNGLTFSILGTGLSGSAFEIATTLLSGSGSDTGKATPQYSYPIVASATGITQPAAYSDPGDAGHLSVMLWSTGPGSTTAGSVVTVYYQSSWDYPTADQTLVNAFNAGYPVYVYISGAPFGNGTWQVTSVGNALPPGVSHWRYYFTIQVTTSSYQNVVEPAGQYQITQATVKLTTAVPGLIAGDQIALSAVTNSSWDGIYNIVEALNSGTFSISQTALASGTATYTWALVSGAAPAMGQLVTVTGTLNANGALNVTNALIATASGSVSGTFTVNGFATTSTYGTAVENGQASTAGTKFIIDPGAALVGNVTQSPIIGNSGGGLLTVVGQASGGTFPIGAGTRQGTVFFITRNGAVVRAAPPSTFTVAIGANYITASNIPIGPPNIVARGISFTEAGQNGVAGANFYTYDTPVTFTVAGVIFTASALIVPDNVTTEMKFTFSDQVLLSSDEIDIPGNNYFNLMELGNPAWIFQYAGRMLYGLCQTKIQNFLNLTFDGGYLPPLAAGQLALPLGWSALTSGNLGVYTISAFSIASNVVTFTTTNSLIIGLTINVSGLSTGTYLNNVPLVVTHATGTNFTVAFIHANVSITADAGTVNVASSSIGLVPSPAFGNSFQMLNLGASNWTNSAVLFQGAYQDFNGVPMLTINTPYSARITGRALNADNQVVSLAFATYQNGVLAYPYAVATTNFNQGQFVTNTFLLTNGLTSIPSTLILALGVSIVTPGSGLEIDRIEIFPTNRPIDTTTIWTSYADNFEAVDIVTGSLGVGVDNPQAAQGAYSILTQLFIEKTNSQCVTQDSPNYEPNNWQVRLSSDSIGAIGPLAFDAQEEFALKATRSGVYFFEGSKPMPISRELQSSGWNGSLWEKINWAAGATIWLRNDTTERRVYIGVPLNTPNFWMPNDPSATPTSPNVILMLNYTGCPTAEELESSSPVHTTMFGDLKALDMRRKWSIWRIASPVGEFILRSDGQTHRFMMGNGYANSKIYQFVNGAPDGSGQNVDDGRLINWEYWTYGMVKSKQGMMQPGLGALRRVAYYMAMTMEGSGQMGCTLYANSLGASKENQFTVPLPFTLVYPQQNDQERVLELGGQRIFFQFYPIGSGGYAEGGTLMVDMEADRNSPHRAVSS